MNHVQVDGVTALNKSQLVKRRRKVIFWLQRDFSKGKVREFNRQLDRETVAGGGWFT